MSTATDELYVVISVETVDVVLSVCELDVVLVVADVCVKLAYPDMASSEQPARKMQTASNITDLP